jgi:hypothetical protein
MKRKIIVGAIALFSLAGGLVVAATPASAANNCGTQGKINFSTDVGYMKTTMNCRFSAMDLQYQPPASGRWDVVLKIDNGYAGYESSTGVAKEAVRAWGCSSVSGTSCSCGGVFTYTTYTVMP